MNKDIPQPPPPGFVPSMAPPPYDATPMQPNVVLIQTQSFGAESQRMTCPHCRASILTRIDVEANTKTHLFALLLCLIGFWCCVPCPYCMDSCLVKKHYCPACKSFLGQSEN